LIALQDLALLLLERVYLDDQRADLGGIGVGLAEQRVELLLSRDNLLLQGVEVGLELGEKDFELFGLGWREI